MMKLPTQVQLVHHAYEKATPDYSRGKAMNATGVDLTPSLKKLPLCNHMLKRAMIMKRPPRSVVVKPEVDEKTHLKLLQERVAEYRAKEKARRTVSCPYACGWATNYKYKKQVQTFLVS